jgi:hypothetical protein
MFSEPPAGAPVPSAARVAVLLALLGLAACQSQPKATRDYAEFRSDEQPVAVAMRIAENVRACWFAGGRPAFAQYSYAPELTSYSNRPRILVVPKSDPGGLPKLVIEASKAQAGTSVKLFGPLMASSEAAAIHRDVARWAGGAAGC